ncbi:MAG: glycosyltransferase [Thermodesulfobacteriota bacterium]
MSHPEPHPNNTALVIPTRNAGTSWSDTLASIGSQGFQPFRLCVVDSSSSDGTVTLARAAGFAVESIPATSFNHGGTRQRAAASLSDCAFVIFMTQDTVLADHDALGALMRAFDDPKVGAAYGRQLPRRGAGAIESHARFFNYPDSSRLTSLADVSHLGIKAAFLSNSFAAYRREALLGVGGFPDDVIFGEDMLVGARMLLRGWKLAYHADALALHSHDYTVLEEFRRYFDMGVMHARAIWLLERFGTPTSEGWRFVGSELRWLVRGAPWVIPNAILRIGMKWLGYRLGRQERHLPARLKAGLSMNSSYWMRQTDTS